MIWVNGFFSFNICKLHNITFYFQVNFEEKGFVPDTALNFRKKYFEANKKKIT